LSKQIMGTDRPPPATGRTQRRSFAGRLAGGGGIEYVLPGHDADVLFRAVEASRRELRLSADRSLREVYGADRTEERIDLGRPRPTGSR
jgi:hypothetical protein